ncbi:VWA domain-containing protein [Mycobacterium frederiksbergense]|uniref:vWA domain-containing protein n=1 Tax=Mycolicibacterium frederiksbergense TaxID=117567 RepID=UPI0021F35539|nr:VWA domain-containing protein [Mycolicibacterium frederiksbergense]MCV7044731.1 VWA domain-containing protein [Mycolicibacterium frederiksbergense]
MSEWGWAVELNDTNPDPRAACVALIDVSGSMDGEPIAALEQGFASFVRYLQAETLASKRVEVAVVTFGTVATVLVPMQEARNLQPAQFSAAGTTNLAAGIHLALDIIEDRKGAYKTAGLQYYRPWILVLTDGKANIDGFDDAVARLNQVETARGVTVFSVGVGPRVNYEQLSRLSLQRSPAPLDGLKFEALFEWLSASLTNVSNSAEHAHNDEGLGTMGDRVPLPPIVGWTSA